MCILGMKVMRKAFIKYVKYILRRFLGWVMMTQRRGRKVEEEAEPGVHLVLCRREPGGGPDSIGDGSKKT